MKEERITKYIDQLAKGLNVASEHVYEALMKQSLVDGIISLIWVVIAVAVIVGSALFIRKAWKKAQETGSWVDEDNAQLITVILMVVISFAVVIGVVELKHALTALLNPEYWAIKEVLDAIKSN